MTWSGRAVAAVLTLGLLFCDGKRQPPEPGADRIQQRGGISLIPRGKVTTAGAKGDTFVLELEAPVNIEQALSFHQSQLPRDRWQDLQVRQAGPGVWEIEGRRGMFILTGRIRALDPQRVSIRFQRRQEESTTGWIPPVPPDVPTLPESIQWDDRVFDAGGARVEIRGRSKVDAAALRERLTSTLGAGGWKVEAVSPDRLKAQRGEDKNLREILYRVEALGRGSQVGLSLALDELAIKQRPAASSAHEPQPDASVPEHLVPVPADLILWKTDSPPTARKEGDGLLTVTFERPCAQGDQAEKDVRARLAKRGWKALPTTPIPGGQPEQAPASVTATKGKRLVVAIVNRGVTTCSVTLMVTDK